MEGVVDIKKNINKIIIVVSLLINLILIFYILKDKFLNSNNIKTNLEKVEINKDYSHYYFMNNPVDEYFSMKIINANLSEIEIRTYQEEYLKIWKNIYDNIISIIRKKCVYEEDIARYNKFTNEINNSFENIKPLLLAEMLDNYLLQESPEKHSYGIGTADKLKMYEGMIYRNACMLFIPYLVDEYKFPDSNQIKSILENK